MIRRKRTLQLFETKAKRRWLTKKKTAHRLAKQKLTLATTAYEIPGERHDTDDDGAGDDEIMKRY